MYNPKFQIKKSRVVRDQITRTLRRVAELLESTAALEEQERDAAVADSIDADFCGLADLVQIARRECDLEPPDREVVAGVRNCLRRHTDRVREEEKERERLNKLFEPGGRVAQVQGGGKCVFTIVTYTE